MLSRKLACHVGQVVGLDVDAQEIALAGNELTPPNVSFVLGDIMSYLSQPGTVDFICSVATLHHLPLEPALSRFAELLSPGGVLAVIGLYRPQGVTDAAYDALGFLTSRVKRHLYHFKEMKSPTLEPQETLPEIEGAAARVLPGSSLRRHLLFRYSLIWRKPGLLP